MKGGKYESDCSWTRPTVRCCQRIEQADQDYQRIYHNLYSEIDKMGNAWQGKDNVAFANRIKSFEDDFRQISLIMREYAQFLKNSARSYEDIQEELYSQANRLRT